MNELLEAGEWKGATLSRIRDQAIPADVSAWGMAQRKPQSLPNDPSRHTTSPARYSGGAYHSARHRQRDPRFDLRDLPNDAAQNPRQDRRQTAAASRNAVITRMPRGSSIFSNPLPPGRLGYSSSMAGADRAFG